MSTASNGGVPDGFMEMKYFDAYYYAQVVQRTLSEPISFIGVLHDFFHENDAVVGFVDPFPRWTLLHRYIYYCIEVIEFEQIPSDADVQHALGLIDAVSSLVGSSTLNIERAMETYGIRHLSFRDWIAARGISPTDAGSDDVFDYYDDLADQRHQVHERLCEEVFFLCFMNRSLLLQLNGMVASSVHEVDKSLLPDEFVCRFLRAGVLRRERAPAWAKRAVFFRDRGRCVYCHSDISGLGALSRQVRYDHVVPLASGGANDVTNLQLLCTSCNENKGARPSGTKNHVERWF